MPKRKRPVKKENLDRGSWAILLLALAYIGGAMLLVGYASRLPSDGWTYDADGELPTAVAPLTDNANPLRPGDQLLSVGGQAVPAGEVLLRPIAPPANWQVGQAIGYTVLRDGQRVEVEVRLQNRSLSALLRSYRLSGNIWLTNLLWYLIGFGVFLLRPRDTAARLLLLFTTYWTTINVFMQRVEDWQFPWGPQGFFYSGLLLNLLWAFMFGMMIHFVLAFPVRKWPLARRPRLTLGLLYGAPAASLALALLTGDFAFYNVALLAMVATLIIALVAATAHNLWRIHDRVVRAQIGWVALGIASPLAATFIPGTLIGRFLPQLDHANVLTNWAFNVVGLLLPLCFGIAITRYRLFDIDVIIRKTLVYAVLSALLALVYFGSVILLQTGVGRAADEQSPAVIVVSTLIIAALFAPLRRRVQAFIDRRFYRKKYDAQQILARFVQTARDEVALDALTAELARVVQETMEPETLVVWLKEPRS